MKNCCLKRLNSIIKVRLSTNARKRISKIMVNVKLFFIKFNFYLESEKSAKEVTYKINIFLKEIANS